MKYRLISFGYFDAATNMALDEAIMEGIRAGTSQPTIRFYGWDPSAVSIGYFQGLTYEVNLEACRQAGVDVVRRMTGGGAVYHDREGEVTYSLLGPAGEFPSNVVESYRQICAPLIGALQALGIPAEFQPINDVAAEGRKISGNAQTRRNGVLLQHGTVLYRVDVDRMFSLLRVSQEKISDKLIQSVKKRVAGVAEFSTIRLDELASTLETAYQQAVECESGDYTPEEHRRARQLADEKYRREAWNALR